MRSRSWNRLLVAGASLAVFALAVTPAGAAPVSVCPVGVPTYFVAPAVYVGQEEQTNIWSSDVTLHAFCGDLNTPLSHVLVTNVAVSGTGAINPLYGSVNGDVPTTLLPSTFPGTNLSTTSAANPNGLMTDDTGAITFKLRLQGPPNTFLAYPDGGMRFIGLQLVYGSSQISYDGQVLDQHGLVFGGGGIYAATPELDSLVLFGTGAMGMASYGVLRWRSRRRWSRD